MAIDGRIILKSALKNKLGGGMRRVGGRGEAYRAFWWGNVRERENLEEMAIDGRIILKFVF
jgi:hypothetical protein